MATDITQLPSLVMTLAAGTAPSPFDPPNTAANQPASGWFLFRLFPLFKKMYFMLRCNHTIGGNVSAELAT
jgi:hypothetical protein